VSVCWPYRASELCSLRSARLHVAAVTLFAVVFNLPRYFEYEIVCVPLESGNDDADALGARNSTDDLIAAASAAILGKNSSANTSDVGGTLDTVIMDSVTITT